MRFCCQALAGASRGKGRSGSQWQGWQIVGSLRRHHLKLQQQPPTPHILSNTLLSRHCSTTFAMASALRPVLARQALQRRVLTSTLPAFRQQLLRQPAVQRAAFQTTPVRALLPPLPQRIEGGVNDPVAVPEPEPSHGSYHWTAERYESLRADGGVGSRS